MTQFEKYDALVSRLLALGFIEDRFQNGRFTSNDIDLYFEKRRILNLKGGIISLDSIYDIALKSETAAQFKQKLNQLNVEYELDEHEKQVTYQAERDLVVQRIIANGYTDIYLDGIAWKKNDIIITLGYKTKCLAVSGENNTHLIYCNIYQNSVIYRYNIDNWDKVIDMLCMSSNMFELDKSSREYMNERNMD